MENFLDKHYAKEERMQKEGIFDIFDDADIEQRAHLYDDEYGDNTNEKESTEKEDEKTENPFLSENQSKEENEEDDEFAWLQKNIATEDNINKNVNEKNENADEWEGTLFNLNKFPDISKEQSLITIKNKNNLNIQIEEEPQMSTFEMEEQAIRQKISF